MSNDNLRSRSGTWVNIYSMLGWVRIATILLVLNKFLYISHDTGNFN